MPETWERHLPAVDTLIRDAYNCVRADELFEPELAARYRDAIDAESYNDGEALARIARRADKWARSERPAVKPDSPYRPALWLAAAVVLLLIWGLW